MARWKEPEWMKEGFLLGHGWRCLKGDGEFQVSSSVQRVAAKGFDVLDPAEDSLADGVTPTEKQATEGERLARKPTWLSEQLVDIVVVSYICLSFRPKEIAPSKTMHIDNLDNPRGLR
jgi:hypothetical protein